MNYLGELNLIRQTLKVREHSPKEGVRRGQEVRKM